MFRHLLTATLAIAAVCGTAPGLAADPTAQSLGYTVTFVEEGDPAYQGSVEAVVSRDGQPAWRWTYLSHMAEAAPLPPRDLTGSGWPNLIILDRTSRSTTTYAVLELSDQGVAELAVFPDVFFTEDLTFIDSDGDGIAEPTIVGESLMDENAPPGPQPIRPRGLDMLD